MRSKVLVAILFGLLFYVFYASLLIFNYNPVLLKIDKINQVIFNLPVEDTYLLIIRGEKIPEAVYVNEVSLDYFYLQQKNDGSKKIYVLIPEKVINLAENKLRIVSVPLAQEHTYDVRVINYLGNSAKELFILFDSSVFLKRNDMALLPMLFLIAVYVCLVLGLGLGYSFLTKKYIDVDIRDKIGLYYLSYIPSFTFLCIAYYISFFSKYSIVLMPKSFVLVGIIIPQIVWLSVFMFLLIKQIVEKKYYFINNNLDDSKTLKLLIVFSVGEKCIVLFFGFLICSGLFLVITFNKLAELTANIAYFLLLSGLTTELVRFFKDYKSNKRHL